MEKREIVKNGYVTRREIARMKKLKFEKGNDASNLHFVYERKCCNLQAICNFSKRKVLQEGQGILFKLMLVCS